MEDSSKLISILHFNDVYNIEEKKVEPLGGVARFKTALESFRGLDPLVLFSGDLFQPSLLSTAYDGEQMIKPMNAFKIDAACFGNHEFDLDLDVLTEYIYRTNFPWLISNVKTRDDLQPVVEGKEYLVLEKKGLKIGFIGLAEDAWVYEAPALQTDEIMYEDYIKCAKRLAPYLRETEQCDIVIALTHLRSPNDRRLAQEFDGLDLILGGHDHINLVEKINGTYIIKSGADFVEFNKINLTVLAPGSIEGLPQGVKDQIYKDRFLIDIKPITITKDWEPNEEMQKYVQHYVDQFQEKMKNPVLHSSVELETRFPMVRGGETNFSNLMADIVRLVTDCDICLMNSGTFRSDRLFAPGVFTLGDIRLILPWEDLVIKLRVTGEQLFKALENSVSTYPAYDGRFLAVSGLRFAFDPKKPAGERIPVESIVIRDLPLDLKATYTMATKPFMYYGKDGYTVLKEAECLVDVETAEDIHTVLKRFFSLTKDPRILEEWRKSNASASLDSLDDLEMLPKQPSLQKRISEIKRMDYYSKLRPIINDVVCIEGETLISVAPTVDGRIKVL